MSTIKIVSEKGTNAVKKLREQKLKNGLPFMINVKELTTSQCYLEYPNGSIKLVVIVNATREMDVVRELTTVEANDLRKRFRFSIVK